MSNLNDQRILELKKQIEIKKEKLGKVTRFVPITNCLIELDEIKYNLQTLTKDQLTLLLVKLNSLFISARDMNLTNDVVISGFCLSDWIEDIVNKLSVINRKNEEKSLKLMEDKLIKLLSDGKKVELEIDEIESLLKD